MSMALSWLCFANKIIITILLDEVVIKIKRKYRSEINKNHFEFVFIMST